MTDRDVIARELNKIHLHPSVLDAETIISALYAEGLVIVNQGAIASANRRGMERAAVICDDLTCEWLIDHDDCAAAIRTELGDAR